MKLIDNARDAWKMFSMWVASFAVIWAAVPADQQSAMLSVIGLSPERMPAVLGVAFIVTRLIRQDSVSGGRE